MSDCIFCKIANKEIPSKIAYENDYVIAFEDLNPLAPVHILIVPKKHFNNIMQVEDEDIIYVEEIHKAIRKLAKENNIDETGFRIASNCGADAGQTVEHLHFHLLGGKPLDVKMA